MKKSFLLFFLLICSLQIGAQVNDSFSSPHLTSWQGDTSKFMLNGGELQSNSNILNDQFYISRSSNFKSKEWRLDLKLNFNTSSLNFVDFYLAANNAILGLADSALYVRIGNTKDEISLYQRINGSTTLLIDGIDEVTKRSSSELSIVVKLKEDSMSLNYATDLSNPLFLAQQKIQLDTHTIPHSAFTGIFVRQSTASFFSRHFFDNYYAGALIQDTVKPIIQSVAVHDSNVVTLFFSEPVEMRFLQKANNFRIVETGQVPVITQTGSGDSVCLTFSSSFSSGVNSTLRMDSVVDLNSNVNLNQQVTFQYLKLVEPTFKSLIITEVYAKPSSTGLQSQAFEIYNATNEYIDLTGCKFFDLSSDEPFPSWILAPNTFAVVCDDSDTSDFLNPIPLSTMPSLNDASDLVRLTNAQGETISQLIYDEGWHAAGKEEGGWSLEMKDLSKGCYLAENFTSSLSASGHTLGKPNSVQETLNGVEGLRITDLYLPSANQLEITWSHPVENDWALQMGNYSFSPSLVVDSIRIDPLDLNKVLVYFGSNISQVHELTFTSFTHCSGSAIQEQKRAFNAPKILESGEVEIVEVMFNARTGCSEYIELVNTSDQFVDLKNTFLGVASSSKNELLNITAEGAMLAPHQTLLLVKDLEGLSDCYMVCYDALLLKISNWTSLDDEDGNLWVTNFRNDIIDSIQYSSEFHSALLSDVDGVSLEKIDTSQSGLLGRVWSSSSTNQNYATPGCLNVSIVSSISSAYFSLKSPYFQRKDPFNAQAVIQYKLDKPNYNVQMKVFDRRGILVKEIANNEVLGKEGNYFWDGLTEEGKNSAIGIYYIQIVAVHPDGSSKKEVLEITKLD